MRARVSRAAGPRRWGAALAAVALLAACSGGGDNGPSSAVTTPTVPVDCTPESVDSCPLRVVAAWAGVLVGSAVRADLLDDPRYVAALARELNSVTPEVELKWDVLHPRRATWRFGPADRIVDFAAAHDLAVKGHTLVWEQEVLDSTPGWVLAVDDPDELREVLEEHVTTVMGRYSGRVDRWDVVNEPLATSGADLYENHFFRVLGPDYVAEAFEIAHRADPGARLFLNEAFVEYLPEKRAALVELVRGLVEDGVPIDGVGLQLHLLRGRPDPGVVGGLIEELVGLGLEVAVTELDVPAGESAEELADQAEVYGAVVGEALAAGCREVTMWGLTDRYTWVDDFVGPGRAPLVLDRDYRPKPAYDALRDALAGVAGTAPGDPPGAGPRRAPR